MLRPHFKKKKRKVTRTTRRQSEARQEPTLDDFKDKPPMCNGKATGWQCAHYWATVNTIVDAIRDVYSPSNVERRRLCTVHGEPDDLGDGGSEQRQYCNRYERSKRRYDEAFEEAKAGTGKYAPAPPVPTVEEIHEAAIAERKAEAHARIEKMIEDHQGEHGGDEADDVVEAALSQIASKEGDHG